MIVLLASICGTLFGAGLAVSGMINPQKVLAFLDIAGIGYGTWDPTLGVVFAAALAPMFVAYVLQRGMAAPLCAPVFQVPARSDLDGRLIGGAAIFGAGWGLVGLCPGPALAAIPAAIGELPELLIFIAAMLAGIWLATRAPNKRAAEPNTAP
jgi:uncharacterized membrane protein YedE/YeeE